MKILTCDDWCDGPLHGSIEVNTLKFTYVLWKQVGTLRTYRLFNLSDPLKKAWEIHGLKVLEGLTHYGEFTAAEADWSDVKWPSE
jgi:hypothetical protein